MIQAHLANQANTSYQIRNRIAAIAEGYDGSTDWAQNKKKGDHPAGTNKCSQFVNDVVREAGAEALVTLPNGTKRPPTAAEWANSLRENTKLACRDVAAYRIPGGGVGATGHSGIVIADPKGGVRSISAHRDKVGPPSSQFIDPRTRFIDPRTRYYPVVFRRYTGG
jgi:hypothetical protein